MYLKFLENSIILTLKWYYSKYLILHSTDDAVLYIDYLALGLHLLSPL